jgi:hypothetical protein
MKAMYNIVELFRRIPKAAKVKRVMTAQQSLKKDHSDINVVFLIQYIPSWNNYKPIYNAMLKDASVNPYIVCVPNDLNCSADENEVYKHFADNGYECINAKNPDGSWFDLETVKADYVFYSRPYNHFMPSVYQTSAVARYAKICDVLYGMIFYKEMYKDLINRDFFMWCYCFYADSVGERDFNIGQFASPHKKGLQRSVYLGHPGLTQIVRSRDESSSSWDFSKGGFRIMWTPRWTTDEKHGGTNFFKYKDFLVSFAADNPDADLLFRPHPLAFKNFIEKGLMTEAEVAEFKKHCAESSNMRIDQNKEYAGTLWNTDVLVTDVSGIMFEYFVTGKPMVFCNLPVGLKYVEEVNKLLEGCYIINNASELEEVLIQLKNGNDTLKEKRHKIIEELFGDKLDNADRLIVEDIKKDYGIT